ncbi:MAG: very short patch repair endonuclease [Acidobacteriaceae bacterium]
MCHIRLVFARTDRLKTCRMTDTRTPEQRRRIMQSVGTKDTEPELMLRKFIYRLGFRYRLHIQKLPGKPDIAFPGRKKVIFVHGCFWHAHNCEKGNAPKSRLNYWGPKLAANKRRDTKNRRQLRDLGWSVMTVWQCELKDLRVLERKITHFLK